jgi:hypothetical protein
MPACGEGLGPARNEGFMPARGEPSPGMSGFVTRWSIGQDRQVTDADKDADGNLTAAVVGAWLSGAVDAYLAQCHELTRQAADYTIVRRMSRQPRAGLLGHHPTHALVTASATEIRPAEFVVSVRVTPFGGDEELPINVTCRVSVEDVMGEPQPLSQAVRDEIVALEQAAEYMA